MRLFDFIGEATEYDKKEMLEERKPKSWLKSVSAFANGIGGALFFGVSNDEALDDKEYSGSLISLLQNGIEFVKNNTKKRWKKTGNGRVEMPEYPE
ncbi:MAG: ATP-binding protein [Lachnospiraceae bacterium]